MTRHDDFIGQLESYLDEFEGDTPLPDTTRDDIRAALPSIHQRPAWWPGWRFPEMSSFAKLGVAAAVMAVAAVLGFTYLVAPNVGGPGLDDQTPTQSPAPTATPQPLGDAPLEAGQVIATGFGASESVTLRFTVPDGWTGFTGVGVLPLTGTEAPDGMGIVFGEVNAGLFGDPCDWSGGAPTVPVGPSVEDLANALADQTGYEASGPVDVSLGGYSGKRVDLQLPSDVASCDNGEFYPWVGSVYAQGPDNIWHVWILDVEGDRIVVLTTEFPGTSAADRAEQQAIVDSISLEP